MNRSIWLMLALALVLAGCGANEGASQQEGTQGAEEHASHEPKGEHESEGEHEESGREIHLTDSQLQRLDIEVGKAEAGQATAVIEAPATVRFDADRVARIGPRLSAKVVEVLADLGEAVEAGDSVAVMDSVALGKAKARHLTTKARLETARAEYQREKGLAEKQIASKAELLEAKAKLAENRAEHDAADEELRLYGLSPEQIDAVKPDQDEPLSRYVLTTPIAGVIQQRDLVPGETVGADETPIHVVDTSRMWVMIEAYEQDLLGLESGLPMSLSVRPLPERNFEGQIDWISRELDEQSRTVRVRASVDNPAGLLRAGMFGTARVATDSQRQYAMVPVDAVQSLGDDDVVFVPGDEQGAFRAVTVEFGAEGGGRIEVRRGLQPGDAVVVAGAFDLKSALTASERSAAHSH